MPRPVDSIDKSEDEIDLESIPEMDEEDIPAGIAGDIEVETNTFDTRMSQYRTAVEELGIDPDLVYEPANGDDISTAEVFSKADVLYAEVMEAAAQGVSENYDVALADGENLQLSEEPDLVVFRNAAMDETQALENNPAEYVFANDHLRNASGIENMEEYSLVGIVPQKREEDFEPADSVGEGYTPDDLFVFERN